MSRTGLDGTTDARKHLNFRIDSYTPETLPMARLAQYLAHLSTLYGSDDCVHFERLKRGSAVVQVSVEEPALPTVLQRLRSLATDDPDADAHKAFRAIDKLLRSDNAVGTITHCGNAKILEFPGRKLPVIDPIAVCQPTSVDGVIIKIGGRDETVPVTLRDIEGRIVNCEIRGIAQAKELSRHYLARR